MSFHARMPPGLDSTPPRSPQVELHIVGAVGDGEQSGVCTRLHQSHAPEEDLRKSQGREEAPEPYAGAAATGGGAGGGAAAPNSTPGAAQAAPKLTVRLFNIPNQAKLELEAYLFDWAKRHAKHYASAAPGYPGWVWWSGELGMTLGLPPDQQGRCDGTGSSSSSGGSAGGDNVDLASWEDRLRCHTQPAAAVAARAAGRKRRRGTTPAIDEPEADVEAEAGGSGDEAGSGKTPAAAVAAQPSGQPPRPPATSAAPSSAPAAAAAQQLNHTEKLAQRARAMAEAAAFNSAFERANNTPVYDRLRVMPLRLGVGLAASAVPVDTAPAPLTAILPAAGDSVAGRQAGAAGTSDREVGSGAARAESRSTAPSLAEARRVDGGGAGQAAGEAAGNASEEAAGDLPKELMARVMGPVLPVLLSPSGVPMAPRPEAGGTFGSGSGAAGGGGGRPQKRQRTNGVQAANNGNGSGGDGGMRALVPQYNFLLSRCWNCGSYGHDIHSCFRPRDHAAVDRNRRAAAESRAAQEQAREAAREARAAMRQQRQGGGGGARERGAAYNRYFTTEPLPEELERQPNGSAHQAPAAPGPQGAAAGSDAGAAEASASAIASADGDAGDAGAPAAGWGGRPLTTAPPGVRPGVISRALAAALGMASPLDPPPWLTAMSVYGLPPSYCDPARAAAAVAAAERAAGRGGRAAGIRVYGADGELLPMPGEQEDGTDEDRGEQGENTEAPRAVAGRGGQEREPEPERGAAAAAATEAATAVPMAGDHPELQAAASEKQPAPGAAEAAVVGSGPVGGAQGSVDTAGQGGEMSGGERCSLRAALEALAGTGALTALSDALLGIHSAAADGSASTSAAGGAAATQEPVHGGSDGPAGGVRSPAPLTSADPVDQDAGAGAPPPPPPVGWEAVGLAAAGEAAPCAGPAVPASPGPPPPPLDPVDMLLPSEPRLVLFPGLNAPPPEAARARVKAAWARTLAVAQRIQAAVVAARGPLVPSRPSAGKDVGQQLLEEEAAEEQRRGRGEDRREELDAAAAEGEHRPSKRGRWGPPGPAAAAGGTGGRGGGGGSGQQPGGLAASAPGAPPPGDARLPGPTPHHQAPGMHPNQHSQHHQHNQHNQQQEREPSQAPHQEHRGAFGTGLQQGLQQGAGSMAPMLVQGAGHVAPPPPQNGSWQGGHQLGMPGAGGAMGLGNGGGSVGMQFQQQQQQQLMPQQQQLTPQQQASFALQQQQFDEMLQQQQMQMQQQQQQQMMQQQMLFQQQSMMQAQGMAGQPYFGGEGNGAMFMQHQQGPGMFMFRGMR